MNSPSSATDYSRPADKLPFGRQPLDGPYRCRTSPREEPMCKAPSGGPGLTRKPAPLYRLKSSSFTKSRTAPLSALVASSA